MKVDEIEKSVLDIKEKIKSKTIFDNLELDDKRHGGDGCTENIIWNRLNIKDIDIKEKGYGYINLMHFYIDNKNQKEASLNPMLSGTQSNPNVHIDFKSGNIHPGYDYVKKNSNKKIRQIVLCQNSNSDPGPRLDNDNDEFKEETHYVYKRPRSIMHVHKACYYPLIDDDETLKQNWRYKYLKTIYDKLVDEGLAEEIK